ncbi:tetratricopeptide repeat protein [Gilvimarinus algae]|uniref:Outer membrane lipoprotein BamD-like domain-containing protein n=1 Tax=Gilvimarinus algae TaxID=3058037 RepID=A0ABT8TFG2_9GAMM|nr:hypothetical protein [Gilvimarinus sp. SDUM040014]MDO3382375.1 hypothetical protein [Gilvimarinus sp. SDUM040014]
MMNNHFKKIFISFCIFGVIAALNAQAQLTSELEAWQVKAENALQAGEILTAYKYYSRLVYKAPENKAYRLALAAIEMQWGHGDSAQKIIAPVLALYPYHKQASLLQVRIDLYNKMYAAAEARLLTLRQYYPDDADITNSLSSLYGRIGQAEKAESLRQ